MRMRRGLLSLSGHEVALTDAGAVYVGQMVRDDERRWGVLPDLLLAAYEKSVDARPAWVRPYGVAAEAEVVEAEVGTGTDEPMPGQWWRVAVLRVGPLWLCEYDPSWTWLRLTVDGKAQAHYRPSRPRSGKAG